MGTLHQNLREIEQMSYSVGKRLSLFNIVKTNNIRSKHIRSKHIRLMVEQIKLYDRGVIIQNVINQTIFEI